MPNRVAAILLAAGQSRRMGRCKQLLPLGGTTVLGRCLDTLAAAGLDDIVVVVSPAGEAVAAEARRYTVRVVVNPEAGGDMASSLLAGRNVLATGVSGVIVALCDYPLVQPSSVVRLVEFHAAEPDRIIIPSHEGRRGHPLLVPRLILDELQGDLTLRDLVRRDPDRLRTIEVDDPGILLDMDTPEEYRRLCTLVAAS